jgi:two-component system OmpR family response regulator
MKVLVVEDDTLLADGLGWSLRQESYKVDWARNGVEADHVLSLQSYDMVILDLGLPKMDGLEVLRRLRKRGSRIPVLILTARDALEERVAGLDAGADDYLVKPFHWVELEARVRALIRRGQGGPGRVIKIGDVSYDLHDRQVQWKGKPLDLSAHEQGVLEVLLLRAGRVVSKEQLVDHLYEQEKEVYLNTIEVYVHRLRKKLEGTRIMIRTIRGLGYLLEELHET